MCHRVERPGAQVKEPAEASPACVRQSIGASRRRCRSRSRSRSRSRFGQDGNGSPSWGTGQRPAAPRGGGSSQVDVWPATPLPRSGFVQQAGVCRSALAGTPQAGGCPAQPGGLQRRDAPRRSCKRPVGRRRGTGEPCGGALRGAVLARALLLQRGFRRSEGAPRRNSTRPSHPQGAAITDAAADILDVGNQGRRSPGILPHGASQARPPLAWEQGQRATVPQRGQRAESSRSMLATEARRRPRRPASCRALTAHRAAPEH